ncbi:hypothetical protein F4777DRAFT_575931 [Nemania sp. FL0916]|nr:hypothetical protein F4777DRAFT_575931 [Nemania sp. FL0916]
MIRQPARSLRAADGRPLDNNESQDSQEKLLFLIQEHGIGVTTNTRRPDSEHNGNNEHRQLIQGSAVASNSHVAAAWREPQHRDDASDPAGHEHKPNTDRYLENDAAVAAFAPSTDDSNQQLRSTRHSAPPSSAASVFERPARPIPRDARPANRSTKPPVRDDATSRPLSSAAPLKSSKPLRHRTRAMSSQSTTQPNEGRSYEQYAREGSQPSSPPATFADEHRTLQEGDTGYVNFKYPFDLPDTLPAEPETPFPRDKEPAELRDRTQSTSQTATTTRLNHFALETPAPLPKPFLAGGNGHVMPASQLFGQTQPTSALRKASPTSSRPSPNVFANNVTSPTNPTSSPLKNRGFGNDRLTTYSPTSPASPPRSSRPVDSRASQSPSPADATTAREELDEDGLDKAPLPRLSSRRDRAGLEPIDEYRPYQKRSSGDSTAKLASQYSQDSDFERDEAELRRQRARSNKERASKSFPEISVSLPSSAKAKVEVPSTNRARRSRNLVRTQSEQHPARGYGESTENNGSQETVVDSQDAIDQQKSMDRSDTLVGDHNQPAHKDHTRPSSAPAENTEDRDMIPETSPACTFTEQPKLIRDIMRENSSGSSGLLPLSYPIPSVDSMFEFTDSLDKPNGSEQIRTAAQHADKTAAGPAAILSSPSVVLASSPQSSRRRSDRLNKTNTPSSTAPERLLPDPGTSSSSLSALSSTPVISSPFTSNTENDPDPLGDFVAASPVVNREHSRGRPSSSLPDPSPSLARLKTIDNHRKGSRKGLRRFSRHSSLSLDELETSPTSAVPETTRSAPRKPPRKSATLREFQARCGIFEGMVFAISLQDRQQSQHKGKDKSPSKSSLEDSIRQEGGTILDDGFNDLFQFDSLPTSAKASSSTVLSSSLKLLDSEIGFAALIADGHSRKVKYMQALALGIPCLAPKWITACVVKQKIVDWSSYLLCSGSSTLLGDAIRSRNLQPYDAATIKFTDVIAQRPKLLDQCRIILIMKKTKNEEKRLPYVFLAQVLGASLVRVHSIEEARAKLREAESGNEAFDWVYVDDHLQDARVALFGPGPGEIAAAASKKRKRASTGTAEPDDHPPPKRIRTLNDELVIQSLILGRLIEEDEWED